MQQFTQNILNFLKLNLPGFLFKFLEQNELLKNLEENSDRFYQLVFVYDVS